MNIVSNYLEDSVYEEYQSILKSFNLTEFQTYIDEIKDIKSMEDFKYLISFIKENKNTSLSYRFVDDKYFMICIYSGKTIFVINDQNLDIKKEDLTKIVRKLIFHCGNKIFVWNIRKFISPIFNDLLNDGPKYIKTISSKLYDVQIIDHLINLKKDPDLILDKDENDKKIDTFIEKVHKNNAFYYYIPRHILKKSMIKEAVAISMMGQTFGFVSTKLDQMKYLSDLQLFSLILLDIEKNSKLFYDIKKVDNKEIDNSFANNLFFYSKRTNGAPIKLNYKMLNSTTGRLSFKNESGINLMAIPKNTTRELFIPENNVFLSVDVKGMEAFYSIKKYSSFLENKETSSDFDIYNEIGSLLDNKYKRSIIKLALLKYIYRAKKFTEEEMTFILELEAKIPELCNKNKYNLSKYTKTKQNRIIKTDKMITKYINNIIQSESNYEMLWTLVRIWVRFKKHRLKSKIKLLVHDQIIFDVVADEVEIIKEIIEESFSYFPYEIKVGVNLNL